MEYNLLFFAIDEDPLVEPDTEENGQENQAAEGGQTTEKENCQEKIYEFLENNLELENVRNFKLEKVFRLGKRKNGAKNPRPIVVKFRNMADRATVKNASSKLKDTKFGISPKR